MNQGPPSASFATRQFARLAELSAKLPERPVWYWSLGMLALLLATDYLTGRQINMILPYMLLYCFVAWCLGERRGVAVGLIGVVVSGLIAHLEWQALMAERGPVLTLLNHLSRLLSMAVMVLIVAGLRCALERERWRAATDTLTGVLNKGAFEMGMNDAILRARGAGGVLVLAYMDLDGFKEVNDRYGHIAGDHVLRTFARAAAGAIRAGDLFARNGGDEFVALLTVPTAARGQQAAEMLHARLTRILEETGHGVTCSMGALVLDTTQLEPSGGLIALADRLMYEAKRSGKDRLHVARGDGVGAALRDAFPVTDDGATVEFERLLDVLDHEALPRRDRRAAARAQPVRAAPLRTA